MSVQFRSAMDWWLFPALFVAPLLVAVPVGIEEGEPAMVMSLGAGLGVLFTGLVAYFTRGTTYLISDRYLTIRSGGLETILDRAWIQDVTLTRNLRLAPCRSSNRVSITYSHGQIDVSPVDREAFVLELTRRRAQRGARLSYLLK